MDFLLHFHIKTDKKDTVVKLLEDYAGISALYTNKRTDDLLDKILSDLNGEPDYYVVNQSSPGWQSVQCNSFKKLYVLGKRISTEMSTYFIQTLHCAAIDYAYFLVYENGEKIREIEATGDSRIPLVNDGQALFFEERKETKGKAGKIFAFDLDMIASYCLKMGINISNLWDEEFSYVLDKDSDRKVLYNVQRERLKVLWGIEREANKRLMPLIDIGSLNKKDV